MSVEYSLEVDIAANQVAVLRESGYNLCIARLVNGTFDVVWYGGDFFLEHNRFVWKDEYQVFGAVSFKAGSPVLPSTNSQPIMFGQTCAVDKAGVLEPATGTPEPSGTFYFEDDHGLTFAAVGAQLGDDIAPAYVAPFGFQGTSSITPTNNLMVWFDSTLKSGDMFSFSGSAGIEVDYNGTTNAVVAYDEHGAWSRLSRKGHGPKQRI